MTMGFLEEHGHHREVKGDLQQLVNVFNQHALLVIGSFFPLRISFHEVGNDWKDWGIILSLERMNENNYEPGLYVSESFLAMDRTGLA